MTGLIKLKRALTQAQWESSDIILDQGEPGVALDTGAIRFGDGVNPWSKLKGPVTATATSGDARYVRKVNGVGPDATGNVTVATGGGTTVTDATTTAKGIVQLAGDLGGTAAAPTVPALAQKLDRLSMMCAVPFSIAGGLATGSGKARLRLPASPTGVWYIQSITAAVNTAPTGAAIILDVNKNGTTIFGTAANRPTIGIGAFGVTVSGNNASVGMFTVDGDYLTIDVDQVGSTVAGADLTLTIWLRV